MGIVVSLPCSFGELLLPKTVWFWGAGSECFAPRPQEMVTWPRPGQSWYPIPPAHLESPWEGHVIKQDGPARPRYHMSLLRERQAPSAPLGIKPRRSRAEAVHSSGRRTQVCCWSRKEWCPGEPSCDDRGRCGEIPTPFKPSPPPVSSTDRSKK